MREGNCKMTNKEIIKMSKIGLFVNTFSLGFLVGAVLYAARQLSNMESISGMFFYIVLILFFAEKMGEVLDKFLPYLQNIFKKRKEKK